MDEIDQAITEIGARHGRIDILVNNASIQHRAPLEDAADADWLMGTNLDGVFSVMRRTNHRFG